MTFHACQGAGEPVAVVTDVAVVDVVSPDDEDVVEVVTGADALDVVVVVTGADVVVVVAAIEGTDVDVGVEATAGGVSPAAEGAGDGDCASRDEHAMTRETTMTMFRKKFNRPSYAFTR